MEGLDTFAAFAATYESLDDAETDYEAIKSLYYDEHMVDTFDAAVIAKDDKGKVKIVKKHEQPLRQGAWVGGGLGLATGLCVALFSSTDHRGRAQLPTGTARSAPSRRRR